MICGQCLIDEHKTHGGVKYASDVLGVHISELQKILPIMEGVLESGENALLLSQEYKGHCWLH